MIDTAIQSAATLLDMLASARPESLRFLVADPRFHRDDLLELLLCQAESAQLTNFAVTDRSARLAISIASHLRTDPELSRSVLVRAHCLLANAFRLNGLLDLADESLRTTARFLETTPGAQLPERALYCRTLSLVRWDHGRLEEALALLSRSESLFDDCQQFGESTTCLLLIGLLHDEMDYADGAAAAVGLHLHRLDAFAPTLRPWLTSRALLTFASLASEKPHLADAALQEGIRQLAYVTDSKEILRLYALEGRARARCGFIDEAEQLLEGVRREHLEAQRAVEVTLSSLDLLALRVSADLPPRIDEMLRELQDLSTDQPVEVENGSTALDLFVSWVSGDEAPWTSAGRASTWYRQTLRFAGVRIDPLPFA